MSILATAAPGLPGTIHATAQRDGRVSAQRRDSAGTVYPGFDRDVPPGGYAWWYADAISADGQFAITLIAFIGSVFSPYYFSAKRRNPAVNPHNHCSVNIALYRTGSGKRGRRKHWCMTERRHAAIATSTQRFTVGPSHLDWNAPQLKFSLNEWTNPWPSRVCGEVTFSLSSRPTQWLELTPDGAHCWWPVGATSRVCVDLESPQQRWHGDAYVDMNWGSRPLENDMHYWCWSRHRHNDKTLIHYDVYTRDTAIPDTPSTTLAISVDGDGQIDQLEPAAICPLKRSGWQVPRFTRSQQSARVLRTVEDTPFYARSLVEATLEGQTLVGVHESLSLQRFRHPVVQKMLPFRMPRKFFAN